uniref:B-like cyclin n=1 Tax=Fagus sylvatica TaxID=28930 RepID=A0A2N9J1U0_FAGSY
MAEQEKCVRITRAALKRAATAVSDPSPNKKRAVLGDLTNLSNVVVSVDSNAKITEPLKPKSKTKANAKKPLTATLTNTTTKDTLTKLDVDANSDDPQLCGAYASDIYDYHHKMEMEQKRRPMPEYIERVQKDITANMRGVLVDWLVEVAEEYKLLPDTLYLCISYVDRKYEEILPPELSDFCDITDNTYTKDEVIKMEADILKLLKFEMGNPTVKTFLIRFTSVAQMTYKTPNLQLEFLGYYLAELSLLDYSCVKFLPSLVAASVIFLAKYIIQPKIHPWCPTLQQYSGYKPVDLAECVHNIHELYVGSRGGSLQAIREKYKQHKEVLEWTNFWWRGGVINQLNISSTCCKWLCTSSYGAMLLKLLNWKNQNHDGFMGGFGLSRWIHSAFSAYVGDKTPSSYSVCNLHRDGQPISAECYSVIASLEH